MVRKRVELMSKRFSLVAVAFSALVGVSLAPTTATAQPLTIRNVTLIDGTGTPPQSNMTVVVNDGRIVTVGGSDTTIQANTEVIDGAGKYLIPGLMDVHIHVPGSPAYNSDGEITRPANRALSTTALHSFLYSGVTTIYDAGNQADYIMELRADERSGDLLSPRIFATGSTITFPGSWGAGPNATLVDEWPADKAGLDANFARKPDLQKITYENFGAGANPWVPTFSDDLITEIIQHAKSKGVRTTIHISDEAHARVAIAAGIDTLAHPVVIGRMSDGFLPLIAESGVIVVSSLAVFDNIARIVDDPSFLEEPMFRAVYTAEQIEDQSLRARPRYASIGWGSWFKTTLKYSLENVKRMHDAGVVVALGTDRAVGPLTQRELELVVESGISPLDAITIGTLNAAKYLGREDELGTIEPGKLADMVLLNADPIKDIRNTQKIAAVFKGGVEIDRDALQIPGNAN